MNFILRSFIMTLQLFHAEWLNKLFFSDNGTLFSLQKRCYYILFLWLNLPQKYRQGTLKSFEDSAEDVELNPVETMPKIKSLLNVLVNELNAHNINLVDFSSKILNENVITVRNMIMTPLPWEIMSWKMKIKYARIWFWLKQRFVIHIYLGLGLET